MATKQGATIVRVWDQDESRQYYLDLYDNISIAATYQFSNIQDFKKTNSNFSKGFRIPATKNNMSLFGALYNPNVEGKFNPQIKSKCVVEYETIPQLEGYLQLKNVIIQKGKFAEYDIIIYGETATIGKEIGDRKICDYTDYLDTLDHTFDYDAVKDSWTNLLKGGDVIYPLADWGANLQVGNGTSGGPNSEFAESTNPISADYFKPAVKFKSLLKAIFEFHGFTWDSNFLDNDPTFQKMFIPFPGGTFWNFNEGTVPVNTMNALSVLPLPHDDITTTRGESFFMQNLSILQADGGFDIQGRTGQGVDPATGTNYWFYEAVIPGIYSVWVGSNVMKFMSNNSSNGNAGGYVYSQCESSLDNFNTFTGNGFMGPVDWFSYLLFVWMGWSGFVPCTLAAGERIRIRFHQDIPGPGSQSVIRFMGTPLNSYGSPQFDGNWVYVRQTTAFNSQGQISFSQICPDMKAIDLLKSLTKMYNLVIIPDKYDTKKLKIEPYKDYIDAGAVVDWTQKLDTLKDYQLKPTTDLQAADLLFTYKSDKDYFNELTESQGLRIYGRKLIDQTNNDFANGSYKVEPSFAATPMNGIPGHDAIIPKLFTSDVQPMDIKPRVWVWHGLQPCAAWYIENDLAVLQPTMTSYPQVSHYGDSPALILSDDLNYGVEVPYHTITAAPINTLYERYWRAFINEIYSPTAKLMIANFNLKADDIFNFQFNDKIWIKDSYWRINKIKNYAINAAGTTAVELVKLPDLVITCDWVPYQSQITGQIWFQETSTGTIGAGTQECCEFYGLAWIVNQAFEEFCVNKHWNGDDWGPNDDGETPNLPMEAKGRSEIGNNKFNPGQTGSVAGQNNTIQSSGSLTFGMENMLTNSSFATLISGLRNKVKSLTGGILNKGGITNIVKAVALFGQNAYTHRSGEISLGGSKWYQRQLGDVRDGRAQHGKVVFMTEGSVGLEWKDYGALIGYAVPLYMNGDPTEIHTIEDLSMNYVKFELILQQSQGQSIEYSVTPCCNTYWNSIVRQLSVFYLPSNTWNKGEYQREEVGADCSRCLEIYSDPQVDAITGEPYLQHYIVWGGRDCHGSEYPPFVHFSVTATLTYTQVNPVGRDWTNPEQ